VALHEEMDNIPHINCFYWKLGEAVISEARADYQQAGSSRNHPNGTRSLAVLHLDASY